MKLQSMPVMAIAIALGTTVFLLQSSYAQARFIAIAPHYSVGVKHSHQKNIEQTDNLYWRMLHPFP